MPTKWMSLGRCVLSKSLTLLGLRSLQSGNARNTFLLGCGTPPPLPFHPTGPLPRTPNPPKTALSWWSVGIQWLHFCIWCRIKDSTIAWKCWRYIIGWDWQKWSIHTPHFSRLERSSCCRAGSPCPTNNSIWSIHLPMGFLALTQSNPI